MPIHFNFCIIKIHVLPFFVVVALPHSFRRAEQFTKNFWHISSNFKVPILLHRWEAMGHNSKQDHQRWGYITVTHMEQPVYLAIWKELDKKKRKGHRKQIEPQKWGGWLSVSFFCCKPSRLWRSGWTYTKCIFPSFLFVRQFQTIS